MTKTLSNGKSEKVITSMLMRILYYFFDFQVDYVFY